MKTSSITATGGQIVVVDDDVAQFFASTGKRIYVCSHGYPAMRIGKRQVYLHRHVMNEPVGLECDHINRNLLDCRRDNLRIVDHRRNAWNAGKFKRACSSKFKGVWWSESNRGWCAGFRHNGKAVHIGTFASEREAAEAYNRKIVEERGAHAVVNPV
jgi:hypothetical protein